MSLLLEWWNFIFLLPLVSGLVIGIGIAVTGVAADMDFGDADFGDVDLGDADLGDVEADLGESADAFDVDADVDADTDTEHSVVAQVLSFFGLGQGLPMSVMLPILLMMGGLSGLLLNGLLAPILKLPVVFAPISLVGSFVLSAYTGQGLARIMRRFLRAKVTAVGSGGLIGLVGRTVYTVTPKGGVIHVKDPYGNIHRITGRSYEGTQAIRPGADVLLTEYVAHQRSYYVEPYALELEQDKLAERN